MWDDSTKPETLLSSALFKDEKYKEHVSMREIVGAEHKKTENSIFLCLFPQVSKKVLTRHALWGASR